MNPRTDNNVVGCTNIEQLNQLTTPSSSNDVKMGFFYNPPNDFQIYHITCEILCENIENINLLSDYTFYYQSDNDKNFYQISCRLISHSLIVQFLNKKIHGIEIKKSEEPRQEYLTFSDEQKENLEFNLKQFLFNYFTPKQINKNPNLNMVKQDDVNDKIIAQSKL